MLEKSAVFGLELQRAMVDKKFIDSGWVEVYRSDYGAQVDIGIYCCLVYPQNLDKYLRNNDWGVNWGSEGHPSIITSYKNGDSVTEYFRFADKGLEPLIFPKRFSHTKERYVDISIEFINYFKLYEKAESKQSRIYYFIDDLGDMDEAIKVTERQVFFKLKYILEYLAVRKLHLSLCFDIMCMSTATEVGDAFIAKDEVFTGDSFNYRHLITRISGVGTKNLQSWLRGKTILKFDPLKSQNFWFDLDDDAHESFIIGYNDDGTEQVAQCNSEEHKFFVKVYFKKEVLDKYYGNPQKYKVDGFYLSSNFISLKMDNNNNDYVVVFLNDLAMLPQKEQLHWKHYNIAPKREMNISRSYYDTMILGNWASDSDSVDVLFKEKYKQFNLQWYEKFGWHFYREPAGSDEHHFASLHVPAENNVRSFCEQMLILVKLTIDSLNEEMLVKGLDKVENEKGISKLSRFLSNHGFQIPDLISFLKHLQDLRSGMMAHRFSSSNKNCQKAVAFFDINEHNYRKVALDIFNKSLSTINALRDIFLDK